MVWSGASLLIIIIAGIFANVEAETGWTFQNSPDTVRQPSLQKDPVLKKFVSAEIPFSLWENLTGSVMVDILVNENGTVDSVTILSGLHKDIDSCVVKAVFEFVFSPAEENGIPIPVIVTFDYDITDYQIPEFVNLQGIVRERGTRMPVKNADIYLSYSVFKDSLHLEALSNYLQKISMFDGQELDGEYSIVAKTDSLGKFVFKSLPNGVVSVKIPLSGYEMFETVDTVFTGEIAD
ncbi:MAG: TonB family protein, partial [Fibrobacter sp.]|nr:TonB family protein [Fibrobacter sp.]